MLVTQKDTFNDLELEAVLLRDKISFSRLHTTDCDYLIFKLRVYIVVMAIQYSLQTQRVMYFAWLKSMLEKQLNSRTTNNNRRLKLFEDGEPCRLQYAWEGFTILVYHQYRDIFCMFQVNVSISQKDSGIDKGELNI